MALTLMLTLALTAGCAVAVPEIHTPEELIELLCGAWDFEGTVTIGEQTVPIIGTRVIMKTGDFMMMMQMGEEKEIETGKAWWDADKEKLALKEGEAEPRYLELMASGYGGTYEMDGIPEMGIEEKVICEEIETFVDKNTTIKTWIARNTEGVVLIAWEVTFTRTMVCIGSKS